MQYHVILSIHLSKTVYVIVRTLDICIYAIALYNRICWVPVFISWLRKDKVLRCSTVTTTNSVFP